MANVDPVVASDIRAFEGDDAIMGSRRPYLKAGRRGEQTSRRPSCLRNRHALWVLKTLVTMAVTARISLLRLSDEPESSYCLWLAQAYNWP